MRRDDAVELVAQRLGNRQDLKARILAEMETVIQTKLGGVGEFVPWFSVAELSATSTIPNEDRVPVPSDFVSELDSAVLEYLNPESQRWVKLEKKDYDVLQLLYAEWALSYPQAYSLDGGYFRLRPIPAGSYQLRTFYRAQPASILSSNVETEWLKHGSDAVLAATTYNMAALHTRDKVLAALVKDELASALRRIHLLSEARLHANRDYQQGEEE